jgi:hypothetical protein
MGTHFVSTPVRSGAGGEGEPRTLEIGISLWRGVVADAEVVVHRPRLDDAAGPELEDPSRGDSPPGVNPEAPPSGAGPSALRG